MVIITAIPTPMLMTTSKPAARPRRRAVKPPDARPEVVAPADDRGGIEAGEAAALYRLMTWLSPAFPVGAFSYSSGIEWAVEAGDVGDAAGLRDWLSCMLTDGPGFCDGVFLAHAHRAASVTRCRGLAGYRGTRRCLRALARASARNCGAGTRVHRYRTLGMELRRAGSNGRLLRRRHRLSRRGGAGQRGSWACPGADDACLPARADVELDLGRRAADSARADRQPAPDRLAGAGRRLHRQTGALTRRSTISAARHFAPTSPACGTKRSIPGCSDHEGRGAARCINVVPATAGTHTPCPLDWARWQRPFAITNAAGYGSRRSPGRHHYRWKEHLA